MTDLTLIPSLDGYAVKKDGTVWSCLMVIGRGRDRRVVKSTQWREISCAPDKSNGYRNFGVGIVVNGEKKRKKFYNHIVVLETFVGPCPTGMECRHLNGDKTDCRLENIVWGTVSDNQMDRVKHGTSNRGEAHGMHKLTEADVREIRVLLVKKVRVLDIANKFHVGVVAIYAIKNGKAWVCVS